MSDGGKQNGTTEQERTQAIILIYDRIEKLAVGRHETIHNRKAGLMNEPDENHAQEPTESLLLYYKPLNTIM